MRLLAAMFLTAFVLGCAEDERAPFAPAQRSGTGAHRSPPMREVLERGLADDELLHCDIRLVACQDRVFAATVATRGGGAERPPVRVIDRAVLGAQLADDSDTAPPAAVLRALMALQLAAPALLASEVVERTADGLLAAYSSETDRVVVIDHGRPLDTPEAALTLAHEFVHALQDGDHDLATLSRSAVTTDEREGLLGLVEGEAEVFAALAVAGTINGEPSFWERMRRTVVSAVIASDAPFFAAHMNFPYTFGAEFATAGYNALGAEGIAQRYAAVPRSAREILAGFGAEAPAAGWTTPLEGTAEAAVEDGYAPAFEDAFGAFILHVFLERLRDARGERPVRLPGESVAAALRGDRVVAFERDADLVAVWRLRFESDVAPADVIAEIDAAGLPNLRAREAAGDVLVFAGEDVLLDEFSATFELP